MLAGRSIDSQFHLGRLMGFALRGDLLCQFFGRRGLVAGIFRVDQAKSLAQLLHQFALGLFAGLSCRVFGILLGRAVVAVLFAEFADVGLHRLREIFDLDLVPALGVVAVSPASGGIFLALGGAGGLRGPVGAAIASLGISRAGGAIVASRWRVGTCASVGG